MRVSASGAALDYASYIGGSGFDSDPGVALDASEDVYVTGGTARRCRDGPYLIEVALNPSASARIGESYRVIALQVCSRKSNGRIKGLNIRGRELTATGLGITYERDGFSRANCNDNWQDWVECPAGQIASGIGAFFDAGNSRDSLVGLRLHCRALTLVPAS